jgi:hypothetical protein
MINKVLGRDKLLENSSGANSPTKVPSSNYSSNFSHEEDKDRDQDQEINNDLDYIQNILEEAAKD